MSNVGSVGAMSAFTHKASTPVFNAEPFYIPAELRESSTSTDSTEAKQDAVGLEAALTERLAETIALLNGEDSLSANDRHIVLFNAILQNRDQFPAEAFHIKTDLPGGAYIETEIPAIGDKAAALQPVAVISTTKLFFA
ncbi:hypothetical protein [Shinella sp.]|uniref:hypothetical protein n=1 Tax=Shinella sp. TaxID=1870904 RepID=UPI003D2E44D0